MKICIIFAFILTGLMAEAQRVGIGTANPLKLLSIRGSLLIDQNNENNATLDSAALRFGTNTGVGIASNRTISNSANLNGLDIYTGSQRRISITSSGFVGIGNISPAVKLDVNGGIRATGGIIGDSYLNVSGNLNAFSDVNVSQNLYVADYAAIGAVPSSTYRLRVGGNLLVETNIGINGNMRLDGTMQVDGTSNIDGKITNQGKAIVLSNSGTTLRAGFVSGTFNIALVAGGFADVPFIIPTFSGNNSNVRVSVAQFQPGAASSNWSQVVMTPHDIDPSDASQGNVSTVKIRFHNAGSTNANLGSNAVLYLLVVVTH